MLSASLIAESNELSHSDRANNSCRMGASHSCQCALASRNDCFSACFRFTLAQAANKLSKSAALSCPATAAWGSSNHGKTTGWGGSSCLAARHFSRNDRTSVSRDNAFSLFRQTTVGWPKGSSSSIMSHTDWSAYLSLLTTSKMTSANAAVSNTALR